MKVSVQVRIEVMIEVRARSYAYVFSLCDPHTLHVCSLSTHHITKDMRGVIATSEDVGMGHLDTPQIC